MHPRNTQPTSSVSSRSRPTRLWASLFLSVAVSSPARPLLAQDLVDPPVFVGQRVQGSLGPGDFQTEGVGRYIDAWRLSARPGQRVTIVIESSDFAPVMGLAVDRGGSLEPLDGDTAKSGTRVTVTLGNDPYWIWVGPQNPAGQGSYSLRVDAVEAAGPSPAALPDGGDTSFTVTDTLGGTTVDSAAIAAPAYNDSAYPYDAQPYPGGQGESDPLGLAALVMMALGVVPVGLWARYRWSRLRPELFPAPVARPSWDADHDAARVAAARFAPGRAARVLADIRGALERAGGPEAEAIVAAARTLDPLTAQLAGVVHDVTARALETAEVQSALVAERGTYAYVVVVPNRHEHDHLLRRHARFAAGWRDHLEGVRASLLAGGEFTALTAFLFFLEPVAGESVVLVSFADPGRVVVPGALAHDADTGNPAVAILDASVEFTLSA